MDADEDRIPGLVRDPGADFERYEDIVLARHDYLKSFRLEQRPEFPRDIEREILFVPESAGGAFVVTAVAGIEHDGLDFAAALNHVRPELRLDCFRKVDARDEKFVVV